MCKSLAKPNLELKGIELTVFRKYSNLSICTYVKSERTAIEVRRNHTPWCLCVCRQQRHRARAGHVARGGGALPLGGAAGAGAGGARRRRGLGQEHHEGGTYAPCTYLATTISHHPTALLFGSTSTFIIIYIK